MTRFSEIIIILLLVKTAFAFQSTNLNLQIVDQNGALVSNVTARLKSADKIIREIKTGEAKEIVFNKLHPGGYILEIEAKDFQTRSLEIEITPGKNILVVNLEIAQVQESVQLKRDKIERNVDEVFSGFLSRQEIEALPDDPKELEQELKRRYGEDTIIRVDGFGGKIPSKSAIASIKVSQSSFDAENHEIGFNYVDIFTKVGKESFSGSIAFNFNDEVLNARNPFAPVRLSEQFRLIDFFLMGPVKKDSSSFWLGLDNNRRLRGENIIAVLPGSAVNGFSNSITDSTNFIANLTQNRRKLTSASFTSDMNEKNRKIWVSGVLIYPNALFRKTHASISFDFRN